MNANATRNAAEENLAIVEERFLSVLDDTAETEEPEQIRVLSADSPRYRELLAAFLEDEGGRD